MKRRTFIQACLASMAVPLAVGGAAIEGALPSKRHGLSSEQVDEFVQLALQRFNEQKFKDIAKQAVTYKGIEIDWIAIH